MKELEKNTKILWLKENNEGKEKNSHVEFGHVDSVRDEYINIVWYEGHKLCNDTISEKNLLAIEDKVKGEDIEIGGFSGKGFLTSYGQEYINSQTRVKKAKKTI